MRRLNSSELSAVVGGQSSECEGLLFSINHMLNQFYSAGCPGINYIQCSLFALQIQTMMDYYNENC